MYIIKITVKNTREVNMKRKLLSLIALTVLILSILTSCFASECEITYDYGGARENVTITLERGALIPSDAPKRDGYVFGGWYTDGSFTYTYDFSFPAEADITLYAKWIPKSEAEVDISELVNEITTDKIRAAVKLSVQKYDLGGLLNSTVINSSTSSGSGVIYKEDSMYYYCLTNNHVVDKGGKAYAEINIFDYQLETYKAELLAASAEYDLAAVRFKKNLANPLAVLEFETAGTAVGESVIAIGTPSGQMNSITFGNVLAMEQVKIDGDVSLSNVTFPIIQHDAPINNGSSGGALLNTSLKIVGINYAAAQEEGQFSFGCAVPAEKVIEFLKANGIL